MVSVSIGILGSLLLVAGAAYPAEDAGHPVRSVKNWLFAFGNACMFGYALFGYMGGGSIFFVILQIFIAMATVFMMLNVPDRYDIPFVALVGTVLALFSLSFFEGTSTLLFVVGLMLIGLGFMLQGGTIRRNVTLASGSVFVAVFSYTHGEWIFFWLNTFFAVLSSYHAWSIQKKRPFRGA